MPRLTPAQREVLDLIDACANDPELYLDMEFAPGDMQFLKNGVILHARTQYEDWEEPERRRHLLRLWLANAGLKDGDEALREGIRR
ncbi:MAG: TauD/TfdA family dioxygenase [Candidatus Binataceae bacterium]